MGPLDLINHLLNFAAPAVFVGVFVAWVAPWVLGRGHGTGAFVLRAVVSSVAGVCALLGGLWFFGNDGKMASYLALIIATAASQFWLMRAYR
jgi:uncharacterized membrane protein (DUF441 family)